MKTYHFKRSAIQIIMSEVKDDPSEVLSILNSLGFVGVTAVQLKSFMKGMLFKQIISNVRFTKLKSKTSL